MFNYIVFVQTRKLLNLSEQQLVDCFNEIAESVELPMLLYNFVKHTNNAITAEIAKQVKQVGIKDSSGDYTLIAATDHYFAGSSKNMVAGYQVGACGFVSAQANHIPELYVELERLLSKGDMENALKLQDDIRCVCAEVSKPNEIMAIKIRLSKIIPVFSNTSSGTFFKSSMRAVLPAAIFKSMRRNTSTDKSPSVKFFCTF